MKINPRTVERFVIEVLWLGVAVSFGWAAGQALPDQTAPLLAWVDLWFWAFLVHIAIGLQTMRGDGCAFAVGETFGFTVSAPILTLPSLSAFLDLFFACLVIVATVWAAVWFNRNCAPIIRRHFFG